jgi:hypothetical protein
MIVIVVAHARDAAVAADTFLPPTNHRYTDAAGRVYRVYSVRGDIVPPSHFDVDGTPIQTTHAFETAADAKAWLCGRLM